MLVLPWRVSLAAFAAGGLVAAAFWGWSQTKTIERGRTPPWRTLARGELAAGTWGGAAVLAFLAVLLSVPALALSVSTLLALTSPPVARRVTALVRPGPVKLAATGSERFLTDPRADIDSFRDRLRSASDAVLAAAWIDSYWALCDADSLATRLVAVETRRLYLDEWERRDPERFGAWLAAGPRPVSTWRPRHSMSHEKDVEPGDRPTEPPAHGSARDTDTGPEEL